MMAARANLTDRAKRYRAQSAVYGARRCVLCGAKGRLDVMHLDGNEANGDPRNLAYGCRSCNGKLAAAFKGIGAGVPTNQYNPRSGGIPTFSQYCWAVSQQRHSGEHGAAGAVIHATPKSKRIEYAQRIAEIKRSGFAERWNPMSKRNIWPFGAGQPLGTRATHRRPSRASLSRAAQKQAREQEAERLERKLSARDLSTQLQRHYSRGGTLGEFLQANPGLKPIAKLYRDLENLVKRIGHETRTQKLNALLDERQRIESELARLGFPVNPGAAGAKVTGLCRTGHHAQCPGVFHKMGGGGKCECECHTVNPGNAGGLHAPYGSPFNAVHGRGWIQEWYQTGEAQIKQRATDLRRRGYRVTVSPMGSQATQLGTMKMSLLDIRPGSSGDPDLEQVNPGSGAFERCVEAVTEKGGAYDPRAVCAVAGRKKYGAKKFQAMARAGRRNAKGEDLRIGDRVQFLDYGTGTHNGTVSKITGTGGSAWVQIEDIDPPLRSKQTTRELASMLKLASQSPPPNARAGKGPQHGIRGYVRGQHDNSHRDRWFFRTKQEAEEYAANLRNSGYSNVKVYRARSSRDKAHPLGHDWMVFWGPWKKGNPGEAAAEMSERFHGRPVTEVLEVEEQVHYHEHLADLGELEHLKVKALDGGIVTLTGFDGAILCSNEDGSQLYIRGGDQSVDLAPFAVEKPYHDFEDLGEVVKLWYYTTKDHLGDQGGTASYHHTLSEEDFERRGTRTRRPRLQYSTRDQLLSFSGGRYTVEDEGIKN